jgi:hypothetical protein
MTLKNKGEMWMTTDELSDLVRAHAAARMGIPMPVVGEVFWGWCPGVGPVPHVRIESVPNVVPLRRRVERR